MNKSWQIKFNHLQTWLQQAIAAGWLDKSELARLNAIENQDADSLFVKQKYRPLIVAFFGGTGVGKSSLLNRLAGKNIAKVGIERPTSHEVSLYIHQDFELAQLPEDLPLKQTSVFYHNKPEHNLLAWVDMPDIDSATTANRELVKLWLPYVDYLVYVVTPDRYLYDSAWQILKKRQHKHNLLFIMNHWDQAQAEQLSDFKQHLEDNGIANPNILRTSCKEPYVEDDFLQLTTIINQAIEKHGLELLQTLGIKARLDELNLLQESYLAALDDTKWKAAKSDWDKSCKRHLVIIKDSLNANKNLSIQQNLNKIKVIGSGIWSFFKVKQQEQIPDMAKIISDVWQPRNDQQLKSLNLNLQNNLQQAGLTHEILTKNSQAAQNNIPVESRELIDEQLNLAWLKPGNFINRFFYKLFGFLSWVLPLGVAGWSLYHLASVFYFATQDKADYLETNFISHSLMLIFISWLVPKILHFKLKPSIKSTLNNGLTKGITVAVQNIQDFYQTLWQDKRDEREALKENLEQSIGT